MYAHQYVSKRQYSQFIFHLVINWLIFCSISYPFPLNMYTIKSVRIYETGYVSNFDIFYIWQSTAPVPDIVRNGSSYCFVSYCFFCLSKRERAPKPLLGCQNWVTSMGGCQNLVPGWYSQCRGPAWSVICRWFEYNNVFFFVSYYKVAKIKLLYSLVSRSTNAVLANGFRNQLLKQALTFINM